MANDDDALREILARAAALVSDLPVSLQAIAFARAVDILMAGPTPGQQSLPADARGIRRRAKARPRRRVASTAKTPADNSNGVDGFDALVATASGADEWEVVWEKGTPLDRWLAAIAVAEAEAKLPGLNARQIERLLVDRFRLAGVHSSNIGRDLRAQPKLVTKSEADGRVMFSLTRNGLRHLDQRRELLQREPHSEPA